MQSASPDASRKSLWRRRGLAAFGLLAACGVGVLIARMSLPGGSDEPPGPPPTVRPTTPPTAAERPPIRDTDPVIGVTLGTKHRAYLLADLWRPESHVFNDLFGDVPVSVTFCDLDNCVKAYTDGTRGRPLDLANGGPNFNKARKMLLAVGGRKFEQDTGKPLDGDTQKPFPYQEVVAVCTTWGEWLTDHPDTELRANGRLYPPAAK